MTQEGTKKNGFLGTLMLFVLLVAGPAGSWYYLSSGFSYQRTAVEELGNYGKMPQINLTDHRGTFLNSDSLKNKVCVVGFLSKDGPHTDALLKNVSKLHVQFGKSDSLALMFFNVDTTAMDYSNVLKPYDLFDNRRCHFFNGPDGLSFLNQKFKFPQFEKGRGEDRLYPLAASGDIVNNPIYVLIDKKGVIRNYYDATNHESVLRLVEHLAMKIPRKKRAKPVIIRKSEK